MTTATLRRKTNCFPSAGAAMLCLISIALWIRSARYSDTWGFRTAATIRAPHETPAEYKQNEWSISSIGGTLSLCRKAISHEPHPGRSGFWWETDSAADAPDDVFDLACTRAAWPLHGPGPYYEARQCALPLWLLILLSGAFLWVEHGRRLHLPYPSSALAFTAMLLLVCCLFLITAATLGSRGGVLRVGLEGGSYEESARRLLGVELVQFGGSAAGWRVTLPYWPSICLAAVGPMMWGRWYCRSKYRTANHLCLACGYDLRASKEQCPECGAAIGTSKQPAARPLRDCLKESLVGCFRPLALVAAIVLTCGLFLSATTLHPSPATPPVIQSGTVPIGWLGHPVGSYLTIAGYRSHYLMKTSDRTMEVDTIGGEELARPITIEIDNVDLPADTRCTLKGYETVRMIGGPPAEKQAAREAGRPYFAPQLGWQTQCYFVALSVVVPEDLGINRRK